MMSHRHGLAAKTVSKWQPPKSIFLDEFLQDIVGTSEAKTSVSGKAECSVARGEE